MLKENLLISDLARQTGVSVRTIRYYIMEGLLPSPQVRGRYSVYDEEYLHRIRLIKILKDAYLPLSKIRELLSNLTPDEIKSTLENYQKEPPALNVPLPTAPPQKVMDGLSAQEYIRRVKEAQGLPPKPVVLHQTAEHGMRPAPEIKGYPEEREAVERGSASIPAWLREISSPPDAEELESKPAGQPWVRIEVSPGVELNIRQDIYERRKRHIERLLKMFKG